MGASRDLHLNGLHIGELKSTGGFIVACPSITTGAYTWRLTPEEVPVSPAPEWLLGLLQPYRPATVSRQRAAQHAAWALDALAVAVRDADQGRRNKYLYWAVRRAADEGIPTHVASKVLMRAALGSGLESSEVEATIRSALAGRLVP